MFHFATEFTAEPCGFGEKCPAAHHFATKEAAEARYAELKALESASLKLPLEGISEHRIFDLLHTINSNDSQLLGYRKHASSIAGAQALESTGKELLELAQKGYLNGELVSTASIIDGAVSEATTELRWWYEERQFGSNAKFLSPSLTLSESGRALLEELRALRKLRRAAEDELFELSEDAQKLDALKGQLAQLLLSPSERPFPKVTKDLRARADRLLKAGRGASWTNRELAVELGCSRQAASDTARKLVARGVLSEERVYEYRSGRTLQAYRANLLPIELLGGLGKVLGAEPEKSISGS